MKLKTTKEIAELIETLVKNRKMNVKQMLLECGVNRNVVTALKAGQMPSADKLAKIAKYLDVTVEYLTGLNDEPISPNSEKDSKEYEFNARDRKDIARRLDKMIEEFDSNEALMFDGEPVDDETRELLKISFENTNWAQMGYVNPAACWE